MTDNLDRLKALAVAADACECPTVNIPVSALLSSLSVTARLQRDVNALESLRPMWAQGWTDDSSAAQASANALSELWSALGVPHQTSAMQKLRDLIALRAWLDSDEAVAEVLERFRLHDYDRTKARAVLALIRSKVDG